MSVWGSVDPRTELGHRLSGHQVLVGLDPRGHDGDQHADALDLTVDEIGEVVGLDVTGAPIPVDEAPLEALRFATECGLEVWLVQGVDISHLDLSHM